MRCFIKYTINPTWHITNGRVTEQEVTMRDFKSENEIDE
ncbi:uncharacterized protein G2W53_009306 [Senna tora]|uniref:Uncharacterized protein n=1 Tax=Senna tora TaxID=362788 RepID=A0A834WYC8_9FABA|nr:uncharacterized protein G2W53_009306 [Senna tora]